MARLLTLQRGVQVSFLDEVAHEMGVRVSVLTRALGLSPQTLAHKRSTQAPLSASETERVLGLARLIGQVEVMVQQSGDPAGFRAAHWMKDWLDQQVAALGGRRPKELLDTVAGQSMLSETLAGLQSGTCL